MIGFERTLHNIFVFLLSTFCIFVFARNYSNRSVLKNRCFQSFANSLESCFNLPLPGMWLSEFTALKLLPKKRYKSHTHFIIFVVTQAGSSLKQLSKTVCLLSIKGLFSVTTWLTLAITNSKLLIRKYCNKYIYSPLHPFVTILIIFDGIFILRSIFTSF